jgi:hypothetical protein
LNSLIVPPDASLQRAFRIVQSRFGNTESSKCDGQIRTINVPVDSIGASRMAAGQQAHRHE